MKRISIIVGIIVLVLLWRGCSTFNKQLTFQRPYEFEQDEFVPAGEMMVETPVIVRRTKSFLAEYPSRTRVRHFAFEERWSVDSPHIATVERGGTIHGRTPGWVRATLRLRGFKKTLSVRVGPPLDSVVTRFATREATVGDTVELFLRRYYADGREEVLHRWTTEPEDRDRHGVPLAQRTYPFSDAAKAADTIRFWLRRPGRFHVRSTTHGHARQDTLIIRSASGRAPRLIRAPWWGLPQQPRPDRRAFRCYALEYGTWLEYPYQSPGRPPRPPRIADQSGFDFLPQQVELDSNLIVRGRPDLGMRINPVGSARLEMSRSWRPAGDSLLLEFETRQDVTPHYRVQVAFPARSDSVMGRGTEGSTMSDVVARRIECDPPPIPR